MTKYTDKGLPSSGTLRHSVLYSKTHSLRVEYYREFGGVYSGGVVVFKTSYERLDKDMDQVFLGHVHLKDFINECLSFTR